MESNSSVTKMLSYLILSVEGSRLHRYIPLSFFSDTNKGTNVGFILLVALSFFLPFYFLRSCNAYFKHWLILFHNTNKKNFVLKIWKTQFKLYNMLYMCFEYKIYRRHVRVDVCRNFSRRYNSAIRNFFSPAAWISWWESGGKRKETLDTEGYANIARSIVFSFGLANRETTYSFFEPIYRPFKFVFSCKIPYEAKFILANQVAENDFIMSYVITRVIIILCNCSVKSNETTQCTSDKGSKDGTVDNKAKLKDFRYYYVFM